MSQPMPPARILIVDDIRANIKTLAHILRADYEISVATSGEKALELAVAELPDLILLDVVMPGMDGHAVCRQLKASLKTCNIPIIFVTSNSDATDETHALELGAVDFISKPVVPSVVRARVKTHLGLLRVRAQLVEAEKQAALGQLVAGVAHEMNTPVGTGITAASELEDRTRDFIALVQGSGISEEELLDHLASTARLARLIGRSLERVSELVHSFKSVMMDQSTEKSQPFHIKECLSSTIMRVQRERTEVPLTVTLSCPESLTMQGYPGVLSQVVANLLDHSRRHSFSPSAAGHITLEVVDEGEILQISYRDDGHGIQEEARRRLFDPFYTTWLDHGSHGLGMHTTYHLVTRILGGTILCESSPGYGIHFLIRLPLYSPTV
ncbi:MAG: response regulator [Magnetococcales bacterium]|nr:response regulator [Magnetococcales bacterium]